MIKMKHRFCDDHTGAPNDGFHLNILKTLFRLSRVLVDLYSDRRYEICMCSVILGQLESLRNY